MLGTSLNLTTARLLHYSKKDDIDFDFIKLEAVKADFLDTVKRLGNFDMYKSYQKIVEGITTDKQLIAEIEKLGQTLSAKGIDTKKIDLYSSYAKRILAATKESCIKTFDHLSNDFNMLTNDKECKMSSTVKKFDEQGNVIPLFQTNENGETQTFTDSKGVERYLINFDVLDFSSSERFYKFANKNGFKIHGHTILWHETVPHQIQELAKSDLPPETKKKMASDFLYCYMKSYAKNAKTNGVELESIDILNEIANDDENIDDHLRQSVWRDLMGDDFYIDVLKMARQVFPDTKLMYNDFSEFYPKKRANMIKIIEHIQEVEKTEGVQLLDAVGLQCHLYGDELDYATGFKELTEAVNKGPFKQEVRITELDSAPCGNAEWQQKQMYEVIKAAEENGVEHVSCWNVAGQFSDSFEDSADSGLVDQNGDKTSFTDKNGDKVSTYNQLAKEHSEKKEATSQHEQGATLSL